MIACVNIDGKEFLLDATEKGRPYDLLPSRCLSGRGWQISSTDPKWIDLHNDEKLLSKTSAVFNLSSDGKLSADVTKVYGSLLGMNQKENLAETGQEKYSNQVTSNLTDWEVTDFTFENTELSSKDLKIQFHIESNDDQGVSSLYISPLSFGWINENPFKLDNRKYPVDLPCPINDTYLFTLTIPEGYTIEEVPENAVLNLPGKAGRLMFVVNKSPNKVQIVSRFNISKTLFTPDDYLVLREFWNQTVAKYGEQIVVKKL